VSLFRICSIDSTPDKPVADIFVRITLQLIMELNESDGDDEEENTLSAIQARTSLLFQDISTTLKQWRIFHCVAECGSFKSAAEFLSVSQATVSYALTQLEELLGVTLLKLDGRKYKLTSAGGKLLRRSRVMLSAAVALEKYAAALRSGVTPEILMAVAKDFPTRLLIPALRKYSSDAHNPKVILMEMSSGEVERAISESKVDIAVNTTVCPGFNAEEFARIEYVAVASCDHPLTRHPGPLGPDDLIGHVHVISQSTASIDDLPRQEGPGGTHTWYVNNVETAITAICEGIGYGWVPSHQVRDVLWQGRLKTLPLRENGKFTSDFYIIRGRDGALTPDVDRIVSILQTAGKALRPTANPPDIHLV
jgi:DNA-binding transcriptional LysR family regulator